MSFHPLMVYDSERFQRSERKLLDEGPPFTFTRERRAELDELLTRYPLDQKRSAVLAALYLVQDQQGYLTANGVRAVAEVLDLTPAEAHVSVKLAQGGQAAAIAQQSYVSVETVQSQLKSAMNKMMVDTEADLIRKVTAIPLMT